ncbi:MAG: xanthine dehydrogenase family protein subunit M, partial [Acidobacteriota bacterium]|nr:xanthine dehydrogenase family protein subunit M [Acidobacteriota bacterium]
VIPLRCGDAETFLLGKVIDARSIREAAERCSAATDPDDDIHASGDYKKAMVVVFAERALTKALARAGGTRDA